MNKVKIFKDLVVSEVDDRMFSSFLEHLGRAIYSGIYEPDHPTADKDGFRTDVINLINELNIEYVRYPGGNFVSGYDWKDGVGEFRPKKLDLAWHTIESNEFGINEFVSWAKKADVKVMGAVNMGTGTIKDAAEFIEYTNFESGTYLSDLRASHGYNKPHNIDMWCIGNEMDGSWQIGHLNSDDYGKKAREAAKLMKLVDEDIELVVVGSSNSEMETFPEWDRKVLEYTYDYVDYISLHRYYWYDGNKQDFLSSHFDFNKFIKTISSTVDYVKAVKRSDKEIYLSMDEWNIWNPTEQVKDTWMEMPEILEQNYTYLDAIAFAGLMVTLLNNSDRVKVACLAQLVNVIGPIFTKKDGGVFKQTIYYPFYYFSNYGRGEVLQTINIVDKVESKYGNADVIISSVVKTDTHINVFIVNTDVNNKQKVEIDFDGFSQLNFEEQFIMENDEDLFSKNTFDNPDKVKPTKLDEEKLDLDPCTFTLIRYKYEN